MQINREALRVLLIPQITPPTHSLVNVAIDPSTELFLKGQGDASLRVEIFPRGTPVRFRTSDPAKVSFGRESEVVVSESQTLAVSLKAASTTFEDVSFIAEDLKGNELRRVNVSVINLDALATNLLPVGGQSMIVSDRHIDVMPLPRTDRHHADLIAQALNRLKQTVVLTDNPGSVSVNEVIRVDVWSVVTKDDGEFAIGLTLHPYGKPSSGRIEFKDTTGTSLCAIPFAVYKLTVDEVWSEQFLGVRANVLPRPAGNQAEQLNLLLMGTRADDSAHLGLKVSILPMTLDLGNRLRARLAILNADAAANARDAEAFAGQSVPEQVSSVYELLGECTRAGGDFRFGDSLRHIAPYPVSYVLGLSSPKTSVSGWRHGATPDFF